MRAVRRGAPGRSPSTALAGALGRAPLFVRHPGRRTAPLRREPGLAMAHSHFHGMIGRHLSAAVAAVEVAALLAIVRGSCRAVRMKGAEDQEAAPAERSARSRPAWRDLQVGGLPASTAPEAGMHPRGSIRPIAAFDAAGPADGSRAHTRRRNRAGCLRREVRVRNETSGPFHSFVYRPALRGLTLAPRRARCAG